MAPASRLTSFQQAFLDAFFRRTDAFFLTGGGALLVFDRAPQARPDKLWFGHVRVDPAEEVFANKLCALLGRAEIRDLVDVRALERAGLSLREALQAGSLKDGGLTPGQLAWVLSQITIGPDAAVPGGVTADELSAYLDDFIARLAALARP